MHICALLALYLSFTSLMYVTAVILFYLYIYLCPWFTPTLLAVCVCVCVSAYWPSRVCGGKWGAEERWSMGAWRVAAEGSWWSSATRTAAYLCTDACRCCAGTYSNATGATSATVCVTCGAGESRMPQARHVMPAYPIICRYSSSWFTPVLHIYIHTLLFYTHTHTHTYARARAHTHTHTHTSILLLSTSLSIYLASYLSIYRCFTPSCFIPASYITCV